jgi:hypothetical protein
MNNKKPRGGKRPGAGRPIGKDGPTIIVAASVPESLAADLDAYAKNAGCSRSRAVTEALRGFLRRKKSRN